MVSGGDQVKLHGWTIYQFFFEYDLMIEQIERAKARADKENAKRK